MRLQRRRPAILRRAYLKGFRRCVREPTDWKPSPYGACVITTVGGNRTGAPCSPKRTWAEKVGRSPPNAFGIRHRDSGQDRQCLHMKLKPWKNPFSAHVRFGEHGAPVRFPPAVGMTQAP